MARRPMSEVARERWPHELATYVSRCDQPSKTAQIRQTAEMRRIVRSREHRRDLRGVVQVRPLCARLYAGLHFPCVAFVPENVPPMHRDCVAACAFRVRRPCTGMHISHAAIVHENEHSVCRVRAFYVTLFVPRPYTRRDIPCAAAMHANLHFVAFRVRAECNFCRPFSPKIFREICEEHERPRDPTPRTFRIRHEAARYTAPARKTPPTASSNL